VLAGIALFLILLEMFRASLPHAVPVVQVPNFARDVHDSASLAEMHAHLFGGKATVG